MRAMSEDVVESRRKFAAKMTWTSAISLLIGGSWAWLISYEGGPEALGAVIPLLLVGGIHLITGPVAIYQAFCIRRLDNCLYVYLYFMSFIVATSLLFPPDIFAYVVIFVVLTTAPILISSVVGLLGKHHR